MPKKDDISKDCSQPLPNQGTVSNTWKVSSSMVDICPVLPAQVASRAWISLRGMNDILTYIYLIFYGKSVGKYVYIYICVGLSLYRRSWFSMWWFQTTCDLNISAATNPWERTDPNLDRPGAVGNRICMNLQVPGGASLGKSPRLGSKMRVFSPHFAQLGSMGLVRIFYDSPFNHECEALDICVESIS